ncbi:MAG: 50S ribosomal protein L3 [Nanoarchaeota archaeon]|nr:50S ribosomal protein L3 [Nanoarchaeota archaeon]
MSTNKSKPRAGSLQFWPRKRAKRIYARVRSWNKNIKENKLLGFIGYKVGMTHVIYQQNNPNKKNKDPISCSATIIECPPIKPFSLRFYKNTPYGLTTISQIFSKNLNKELQKKINTKNLKDKIPESFDEVRLIVYTQPKLTQLPKKKPEIIELALSKNDLEYAKSLLNKDSITIKDVFNENQYTDIRAITKGKGTQGPVKRFGIGLKKHKSEKGRRAPGTLGNWMAKTWRVAHAGQMGFHQRTEHNKLIFKISDKPEEITPKSGFHNYGIIKNSYLLIKGSIAGPKKRTIILTNPLRNKKTYPTEITYIKK